MPGPARDPELFLTKVVEADDGCWLWTGYHLNNGYGFCHRRRMGEQLAHRVSYRLFVGSIPDDLTIDHLCRVRSCVNPAHLEAVPFVENVRRGESANVIRARRGTCDRGHPYVLRTNGKHYCRRCHADAERRYYERNLK